MTTSSRKPMDRHLAINAKVDRLGRDLSISVDEEGIDFSNWVLYWGLAVGRLDDKCLAGAAHRAPWVTTCKVVPSRSSGKSRSVSRSGSWAWRTSSGKQTGASEQRTQSFSFSAIGGRSVVSRSLRAEAIASKRFRVLVRRSALGRRRFRHDSGLALPRRFRPCSLRSRARKRRLAVCRTATLPGFSFDLCAVFLVYVHRE